MEKIQPGKYVELGYDLYAVEADGTEQLVHQTDAEDPEKIVFGVTRGVIAPLEKAIEGLEKDGKFNVTATADEAFGPYDPEQGVTLDKDLFLIDGKFDDEAVKPGALVPMMTADGFRINGLVKEVTADKVKMDFNHPLAGNQSASTARFSPCATPLPTSSSLPRAAAAAGATTTTAATPTAAAPMVAAAADTATDAPQKPI